MNLDIVGGRAGELAGGPIGPRSGQNARDEAIIIHNRFCHFWLFYVST